MNTKDEAGLLKELVHDVEPRYGSPTGQTWYYNRDRREARSRTGREALKQEFAKNQGSLINTEGNQASRYKITTKGKLLTSRIWQ
jgi:hypothetical protein